VTDLSEVRFNAKSDGIRVGLIKRSDDS
jgi:hypothetical protein